MFGSLLRLADRVRDGARRRTWDPDLAAGRRGEDIAHRFLQRARMIVVARNHRTPNGSGEVDVVAWDNDQLVFVEVKTRASQEFGPPDRAIDDAKRRKIVLAAMDFARRSETPVEKMRFDVVSVILSSPPSVVHHRDIFTVRTTAGPN
jgi:putative endonuclease